MGLMDPTPGSRTFHTSGDAYDSFMGRYSRSLAGPFADHAGVTDGQTALDVGCGPGALTRVLLERLGAGSVSAVDPSEPFVAACAKACSGVDVKVGRAEQLPYDDDRFDVAVSQLVFHFVTEPATAAGELRRVVRPGGTVAVCVWDAEQEMDMLRHFWDAALTVDTDAPGEAHLLRFGRPGELTALLDSAGLEEVVETTIAVASTYSGFDELWSGFLAGIGPAGSYCTALDPERREAVRVELHRRLGSPDGAFELGAVARSARGSVPG